MGGDSSNTGKNVSPIKGPKIELYVQQPFYEQLAWHHSGSATATAAAKRCGCKGAMRQRHCTSAPPCRLLSVAAKRAMRTAPARIAHSAQRNSPSSGTA